MWWGYSSALDLLNEYGSGEKRGFASGSEDEKTLNVLLIGQSDNRHALKTMAKRYKHEEVKMNFYVFEPLLENVARDLLFLVLALDSENVGLAEKTKFFMELYGNTLIRPATSNYLTKTAQQLLFMITDSDFSSKILPLVSFDQLKYKERDQLEIIFKYWASENENFDILTSWDERMRKSLRERYDAKYGVFDWDYHMHYRSFGAETLNMQEYKRFRDRGMSFFYEDTDPCVPNRTLASAILSAGSKIINYGYLGDIVTGPYPAFGFDCEDPKMLEKVNGYSKKNATDITENNVMRIFYEIMNQKEFDIDHSSDEPYAIFTEDSSNKLQIKNLPNDTTIYRKIPQQQHDLKLLDIGNCKIIFLPTSTLKDISNKCKFEDFFDIVTIPQILILKYFSSDFVRMLKHKCKIIVDTPKYILNYRKEDLEKYKSDVESLMKGCNCKCLNSSFSYSSDEFMRFEVSK